MFAMPSFTFETRRLKVTRFSLTDHQTLETYIWLDNGRIFRDGIESGNVLRT